MTIVVWLCVFVGLALLEKAIEQDKKRMIAEFVKSEKEREKRKQGDYIASERLPETGTEVGFSYQEQTD